MVPARRKEIHQRDDVARASASSIRGRGRGRTSNSTSTLSARSRGRGIPFAAGNSRIARTGRAPMSQVDHPPPFTMLATLTQAPASPPQQQDETMDDIEDSEVGVDNPMGGCDEDDFGGEHPTGECHKCFHLMDSTHVKQIIILRLTIHPRRLHRLPWTCTIIQAGTKTFSLQLKMNTLLVAQTTRILNQIHHP